MLSGNIRHAAPVWPIGLKIQASLAGEPQEFLKVIGAHALVGFQQAVKVGIHSFHRHYVQAPTCGASRYAVLTGTYGPSGNGALFSRGAKMAKDPQAFPASFPAWFRQTGYTTVSVGKVSHHPGGRGGLG